MVLYKGKEISQEDFDNIVAKADSADKLSKGYQEKLTALEEKSKIADSMGDLKKQLETSQAELFKIKLNGRMDQISKYLETKGGEEKLIKRIGDMSDDDFTFFSEGKLNSDYTSREEIDSAKKDLEKKKTEFESEKDKIISDAKKAFDNKEKMGDKMVPNSEVESDGDDKDSSEVDDEYSFPPIEKINEIYRLTSSPYEKKQYQQDKAQHYMNQYQEKMEIL